MPRLSITGLTLVFLTTAAQGLWVPPDTQIPVARLVENLELQLAANPEDPHLLARLARVHSLAYALGDVELPVMGKGENPQYTYYEQGNGYPASRHSLDRSAIAERIDRLLEAIALYEKATKLAPGERYIWLGLGYCYDEMSHAAATLAWPSETEGAPTEAIAALRVAWEDKAVAAYAQAMGDAPKVKEPFLTPPVELEAAQYIRAILEPRRKNTSQERKLLMTSVTLLSPKGGPHARMVTPIIFSLDSARPLESLLAPDLTVSFDLDGTESGAKWPWVKSDTAFLVWDGDGSGRVSSGRQLIGSVTWWLFWEHGYEVLQALDNDRNGWLEGSELTGLAAWQDTNSNGQSDPGEVRPLATCGVLRLSTVASGTTGGMPMNATGLEMSDGRVLPTYDWITAPTK
jgi:hypothetical protein